MENIIEVRGLVKHYKELVAVDDLDLNVRKGRILGLLGPNGSGKTTTINCILSLLSFDKGSVKILGEIMKPDLYHIKEKIGVVFQEVGVFEELTVYENVDYFCGLYIRDKEDRKQKVLRAIELMGLEDFKKFRPKQLSGGLLRRLNVACGIAHQPEILFFDEPTVAVDPQSRNNILEFIKSLKDDGATVIYTSHYMDEIELLCDDIVILDKGKIIAQGNSESLKDLIDLSERITFESNDISDILLSEIKNMPHVVEVIDKRPVIEVSFENGSGNLVNLVHLLESKGTVYDSLYSQRPTLNDVFLELTGKDLRD